MDFDKEVIYDTEIAPLMEKIIEVCKSHKIPMVASYCYKVVGEEEDCCMTYIPGIDDWIPERFIRSKQQLFSNPKVMAFTIRKIPGG